MVFWAGLTAYFAGNGAWARPDGAAGADWFLVGPDGTGTLDVRWALRTTDDAATVFMQYQGRSTADYRQGLSFR